jgi:hypothetical protein
VRAHPEREHDTEREPRRDEQHPLEQQMNDDVHARRTQRRAERKLARSADAARELQVGEIRAGDEQHRGHGGDQRDVESTIGELVVYGATDIEPRVLCSSPQTRRPGARRASRARARAAAGVASSCSRSMLSGTPSVVPGKGSTQKSDRAPGIEAAPSTPITPKGLAVDLDGFADRGRAVGKAALDEPLADHHRRRAGDAGVSEAEDPSSFGFGPSIVKRSARTIWPTACVAVDPRSTSERIP